MWSATRGDPFVMQHKRSSRPRLRLTELRPYCATLDSRSRLSCAWPRDDLSAALPDALVGQPPSTVVQNANRLGCGRPVRGPDEGFRPGKRRCVVRGLAAPLADHLRNAPPEPHKLEDEDHRRALRDKHTPARAASK